MEIKKRYINVFLSLGSNVGNKKDNIKKALDLIDRNLGKIAKRSSLYETQPWGKTDQDAFLNMVVMANTTLSPREVLELNQKIEKEVGRVQDGNRWGPRIVDIDILFYGARVVRDKGLEVPHPEIPNRAFVLAPLLEIAPDWKHPALNLQIDELYMNCTDRSEVVMLEEPI